MYQIVVGYPHPEDPAAFLAHYEEVHVPLVRRMPGVEAFDWMICDAVGGTPEYFLVARLVWASPEAMAASQASEAGQLGAADLANFAHQGVTILAGKVCS